MNKFRKSERLSGLLAFTFSGLFYMAITALIFIQVKKRPVEPPPFSPPAVNLSFAQIELHAAAEPPPQVEPEPAPMPEAIKPEPVPPEAADVAPEKPAEEPRPEPEPVQAAAQVTQAAAAPSAVPVDRNVLSEWVLEQIEKEKYYPAAARNAGYEGQFRLLVKIGTDGKVSEAAVLKGRGHPLLRRSLEKIMEGLQGRDFGQPLAAPVELPFDFEFKLN